MIYGIGYPGILCLGSTAEVYHPVIADDHVLEERIAPDGTVDVRLILLAQVDGLGITASFEVKYPVIVPAVLIVAYQRPVRIGGKGGFAGSREAEEDCDITIPAYIGRAVQWLLYSLAADSNS